MDVLTAWGLQGKHSKLILARKNTQLNHPIFTYLICSYLVGCFFFLNQYPTTTPDQLSVIQLLCELHAVNRIVYPRALSCIGTPLSLNFMKIICCELFFAVKKYLAAHPGPPVPAFQIRRGWLKAFLLFTSTKQ